MAESIQLVYMGANAPRCDMAKDPNTGLWLPGMRLEPEAIQLCKYSRAHNSWTLIRSTVPTTDATAPDTTATADVIHEDNSAATTHLLYTTSTANLVSGTRYVLSTYAKDINRSWFRFSNNTHNILAFFDSSDGSIGTTGGAGITTGSDGPYIDGSYRFWFSWTAPATAAIIIAVYIAEDDNDISFDGLNQDSIQLWGSQLEVGYVPSSPIHNDGVATVTRNADSAIYWANPLPDYQMGTLHLKVLFDSHTPAADTSFFRIYDSAGAATDHITLAYQASTGYLKVTSAATGGSAGSCIPETDICDGSIHDVYVSWRGDKLVAWVDSLSSIKEDTSADIADDLDRVEYMVSGGVLGQYRLYKNWMRL